ncbi:MAG TPA: ArsC/Spx/MgsR family protein [Robiginitalea sp.]|nr:ArsC/Spx/MgsR family protein [Robiginitalea sp.]
MKKIYYLSSCDTCRRILRELGTESGLILQDIGAEPLRADQLDGLHRLAGSYEALINKRARLYIQRGLKDKGLSEADFRALLLEHYTFLKRPVILAGGKLFIGNAPKTVAAAREALHS